ncbi:unnamed protein product [Prorocentrum cordatum]|uniref:Uncharacterized protein n=1 Tax=Prorocentrum cordatum TaxID=2364126 RepID=A0ABN9YE66_9DINO|nr:unnamed protein product [Polarella glacialis]
MKTCIAQAARARQRATPGRARGRAAPDAEEDEKEEEEEEEEEEDRGKGERTGQRRNDIGGSCHCPDAGAPYPRSDVEGAGPRPALQPLPPRGLARGAGGFAGGQPREGASVRSTVLAAELRYLQGPARCRPFSLAPIYNRPVLENGLLALLHPRLPPPFQRLGRHSPAGGYSRH